MNIDIASPRQAMLIIGSGHLAVAKAWTALLGKSGVRVSLMIVERRGFSTRRRLLEQRIRKLGPFRVIGQLLYRMVRRGACDRAARRNPDVPPEAYGWEELLKVSGENGGVGALTVGDATVLVVDSMQDPRALASIDTARQAGANTAIVYGTSILSNDVIDRLPDNSFNLHTGLTQHYRGVNSTFWALADGEPGRVGVTVHRIDKGIDTGGIVAQRVLGPDIVYKWRSMAWVDRAVALEGERLMLDVAIRAANGESSVSAQPMVGAAKGKLCSDPTIFEYYRVLRRFKLR